MENNLKVHNSINPYSLRDTHEEYGPNEYISPTNYDYNRYSQDYNLKNDENRYKMHPRLFNRPNKRLSIAVENNMFNQLKELMPNSNKKQYEKVKNIKHNDRYANFESKRRYDNLVQKPDNVLKEYLEK